MARPVAADAEATKARILDAACALVADHGIEGTSIRDIAKESKVSLATVLHYYGSKDGLYEACIEAMYKELDQLKSTLITTLVPGSQSGQSIEQTIEQAIRASNKFAKQHRAAHRLVLRANIDEGGMRPDRREKYLGQMTDDVAGVLAMLLGVDRARARIVHSSVAHLIVRYSLQPGPELKLITGKKSERDAEAAIEDHIVELAKALLLDGAHGAARGAAE
jgi:AcrR family transcriptional regulator